MNKDVIENLFNKYQQEGAKLQEGLSEKRELLAKTQQEIGELEYAITLKNGNIQALQTLYAELHKEEEAPTEKVDEVVEETQPTSEEK